MPRVWFYASVNWMTRVVLCECKLDDKCGVLCECKLDGNSSVALCECKLKDKCGCM